MTVVRLWVLFLVAVLWPCAPAIAQDDYPTRPVTIVVPFAPGGSVDFIGRLVGQKLSERLGRPVIVENRPGAGSATGALAVSKSAPDGYTLLLAPSGTFAINPTLYKQLSYDPAKDLTPVGLVVRDPLLLVVNPTLPVKTVADGSSWPRRSRVSSRSHRRARGRRCISWASCSRPRPASTSCTCPIGAARRPSRISSRARSI